MVEWNAMEGILQEIGMPSLLTGWVMSAVTSMSYVFNINGEVSDIMQTCRGIRQEDPISPLLFVNMMKHTNRLFVKM